MAWVKAMAIMTMSRIKTCSFSRRVRNSLSLWVLPGILKVSIEKLLNVPIYMYGHFIISDSLPDRLANLH